MNKVYLATPVLFLTTCISSFSAIADVTEVIERNFDVASGAQIHLENINGKVEFSSQNNAFITVVATKEAEDQEALERINVLTDLTDNKLTVKTKYKKSGFSNNNGNVSYKVTLPLSMAKSSVELVNGSLIMQDIKGDIKASLVNGSAKVLNADGNCDVESVNGSVLAKYTELMPSVDKINLSTVNGSIKLLVPSSFSANFDASTMHGSIKNNLGLEVDKSMFSGKSMSDTIGSGDVKVKLESVNGSIAVMSK